MTITYHQDWANVFIYEDDKIIGKYNTKDRCPECGRHTLYYNLNGSEWCFHCTFESLGE